MTEGPPFYFMFPSWGMAFPMFSAWPPGPFRLAQASPPPESLLEPGLAGLAKALGSVTPTYP